MTEIICPYPGLRPFNDDEAIFFKGRDKNITSIIELFEKKKFMMLTGASGDGKSSLVYAGVVPNARAGLFKAKYNSWAIADFRPERTPLKNLTKALNEFFNFEEEELEKKLSYGFSSLVSIYKNSDRYIDITKQEWTDADEPAKKGLKRKASNLLIIADQFEEFFTNTENYYNGVASVESQTVVNILLETAKIALAEDLPIFIICTMRSDYIGQCAAFRGLPEYIGFSHFFVPRLKRNEISQVIEEPAVFNGDKISRRLSERLLNDITDGHDQLPILQHALNQIWKIAGAAEEEMDLIHYAMVGGLAKSQLQEGDQLRLEKWLSDVPEFKKRLFENPSLENILNAHADELLETAYDKYISAPSNISDVTRDDAKLIIKTTFQCLTKIDDSRAVRNRMSLQEIAGIINQPHIDAIIIGKILDIFREQGNTFIKPFITEDPETLNTSAETVLDITHESLIRNWDILKVWANEEYDNLLTWQDFNKQLQRWVKNGKQKGYLLPIGPLTFFEGWYDTAKPNRYWLARYDEREIPYFEKVAGAEDTLADARQFIRRSSKALFASRIIIKYGANRIIAVSGIFAVIFACIYYYFDYGIKQNDYLVKDLTEKGTVLLASDRINTYVKAHFLVNQERLHPGSSLKMLNDLENDTLAFDIAHDGFLMVQNYDKPVLENKGFASGKDNQSGLNQIDDIFNPLAGKFIVYMDSTLENILLTEDEKTENLVENVKKINDLLRACAFAKFHGNTGFFDKIIERNLIRIDTFISQSFHDPVNVKTENLNTSIELLLTLSDCSVEKVDQIIGRISPFTETGRLNFNIIYPRKSILRINDFRTYEKSLTSTSHDGKMSHNGGYQVLSYLYATKGDLQSLRNCVDSIVQHNVNYRNYWQSYNLSVIACYLIKSGNFSGPESRPFLIKLSNLFGLPEETLYSYFLTGLFPYSFSTHLLRENSSTTLIPYFVPYNKSDDAWDTYLEVIEKKYSGTDRLNLALAIYYKWRGNYASVRKGAVAEADRLFKKSLDIYKAIPQDYLERIYSTDVPGEREYFISQGTSNAVYYLFPGLLGADRLPFLDFVIKNNETDIYRNEAELKPLVDYVYKEFHNSDLHLGNRSKLSANDLSAYYNYITLIGKLVKKHNWTEVINHNVVDLISIQKEFDAGDSTEALKIYKSLVKKDILNRNFQVEEFPRSNVVAELLKNLAKNLALINHVAASDSILRALKPYDRRNCLIDIAFSLQEKGPVENTFVYLDSLFSDIHKKPVFGLKLFRVLGMMGSNDVYHIAMETYKDVNDDDKPQALVNFIRGIASTGLYYKARTFIPLYASRESELLLYSEILHAEAVKIEMENKNQMKLFWKEYDETVFGEFISVYYEPGESNR